MLAVLDAGVEVGSTAPCPRLRCSAASAADAPPAKASSTAVARIGVGCMLTRATLAPVASAGPTHRRWPSLGPGG